MTMDAAARYLELSIRRSCLARSDRRRPERRTTQRKKIDPEGLSFFVASRRVARPELQRRLAALGARAEALELGHQLLRELLLAAGAGGSDPEQIADVARLIELDGFRALLPAQRIAVARAFALLAPSRFLVASLLELIAAGTFARLSSEHAGLLLRYLSGPRARSRTRRSALLRWHGQRAFELLERAGELDVRSFLEEVVRPLHLLRTSRDLELAIVVLGDPADKRSLSYEKHADFSRAGVLACRIRSPAASKRKKLEHHRVALLSRIEELELVSWLETNHQIEDGIAWGRGALASSFDFDRRAEEVARIVASSRGTLAFERKE